MSNRSSPADTPNAAKGVLTDENSVKQLTRAPPPLAALEDGWLDLARESFTVAILFDKKALSSSDAALSLCSRYSA